MKLYIDTKADKFDLWDFLHLNNDIFEINFSDIKIKIEENGKDKDKKIDVIEVELKPLANSKKHMKLRYYAKLFDTLKLFIKTHDKDDDDLD
jgi:hypothetical protein